MIEFRQYILQTKGIDIEGIIDWNKTITWILIATAIVVGGNRNLEVMAAKTRKKKQ